MNTLHKHPGHTCVDGNLPCLAPACAAAQLVLHPEHGYYRPSAPIKCYYCGQQLRWFQGRLVGEDGATLCEKAVSNCYDKPEHDYVIGLVG